jgi:hypothetical protein
MDSKKLPYRLGEFLFSYPTIGSNFRIVGGLYDIPSLVWNTGRCAYDHTMDFLDRFRCIPEFQTAPWEIAFHLAAEFTTALLLLSGGIATLKTMLWGKQILMAGLGMVIYSEIVSPGYYAQLGQWAFVAMFAILLFGAAWSVTALLRQPHSSWIKSEADDVE